MVAKVNQGITEVEVRDAIAHIAGDVFELFRQQYPVDGRHYWLNTDLLTCGIQDAATHIDRAGAYHSDTGANRFKKAAYISHRIAEVRPIHVARDFPRNLTNAHNLNALRINAAFAVYALEAMLGDIQLYDRLRRDIRYCFQFRSRMDQDSLAMLLEHALVHSREHVLEQESATNSIGKV